MGHHDWVYWVAFSRDGDRVTSAAADGTVAVWDATSGALLDTVSLPEKGLAAAQIRPGTSDVLIANTSGRAYRWDTRPQHAVAVACRIAGRDFTAEEWQTYVGSGKRQDVCPH